MATIGNFTAQDRGFVGTVRTLTISIKVKVVPSDKTTENTPDFRIFAPNGFELGAAWQKVSFANRVYLAVTLDDPSFQAPIHANLIEDEGKEGAYSLTWSRIKPAF